MARNGRPALLAAVVLLVAVMPVTAEAARSRIRCHDGVLGATDVVKGKTLQDDRSCDVDQTRDGKCTFDFALVHPPPPGCPRCAGRVETVRVRVRVRGRRLVKTQLFGKFLLRCLP